MSIEGDIEHPEESAIFSKYPPSCRTITLCVHDDLTAIDGVGK